MTYEEFASRLKELGISREQFAAQVGMSYHSVTNWRHIGLPAWVEPFLLHYEKSLKLDEIMKLIKNYCD